MIIDDVGNQLATGRRSIALPGPVAIAILPYTPFADTLAAEAFDKGAEILVHLPMQASTMGADPGPGALELGHDAATIERGLSAAIAAVPNAAGISNHMGSLLTRDARTMQSFMRAMTAFEELFFIDSYTTHLSVALMTARAHGIAALKRDVFLDAEPGAAGLEAGWNRLLEHARMAGFAIGIAHPHVQTLEFLERRIAELTDVVLVSLQELLEEGGVQRSYAESIGYAPVSDFPGIEYRIH